MKKKKTFRKTLTPEKHQKRHFNSSQRCTNILFTSLSRWPQAESPVGPGAAAAATGHVDGANENAAANRSEIAARRAPLQFRANRCCRPSFARRRQNGKMCKMHIAIIPVRELLPKAWQPVLQTHFGEKNEARIFCQKSRAIDKARFEEKLS